MTRKPNICPECPYNDDESNVTNIQKHHSSSYALRSQQQLIREPEVNAEKNDGDDAAKDGASSWDVHGEERVVMPFAEQQRASNTHDRDGRENHSPPGDDDATELQL